MGSICAAAGEAIPRAGRRAGNWSRAEAAPRRRIRRGAGTGRGRHSTRRQAWAFRIGTPKSSGRRRRLGVRPGVLTLADYRLNVTTDHFVFGQLMLLITT